MSAPSPTLPLRFALRELRSGLRGFYIFLACIAIGVATIAGVNSLSRALVVGLAEEGQTVLGGDLSFSMIHRGPTDEERAFLSDLGALSEIATLRAMARTGAGEQTLVEIKAVDSAYPLAGTYALKGGGSLSAALAGADGLPGAVAEAAMMARLGLAVGDVFTLGQQDFRLSAEIEYEPDRLSSGRPEFGPRVLMAASALDATGLVQPGSLIRHTVRVALPPEANTDAALRRIVATAEQRFPASGWDIRTRLNASPGLARSIDRFAQFLTLVGLTALIVGGVGVANAVRAHLDGKRGVIATFKALGASGSLVFRIYLTQIMIIALIGTLIGVVIGAMVPPVAAFFLRNLLPVSAATGIYPGELVMAVAYGLLTALAFALWPLGRARDVPVSALFRDRVERTRGWPRPVYTVAVAGTLALLATMAIGLSSAPEIAAIYIGVSAAAFVLLRLVAAGIMALAARAPRVRSTALRLAIRNIHRPDALTPSVVLSLGLGLALLVALSQIDGNLSRQLSSNLPERAPSFFFVDIQRAEAAPFTALMAEAAPDGTLQTVPMLRGRITALKGIPARDYPGAAGHWVLRGDRGITHNETLPADSEIIAGEWWPENYDGPPLVSFVDEEANELGLTVGDTITVNVLGRNITATIANLRTVNWSSLGINFVMTFSPNTFAGAPYTVLATLTFPDGANETRDIEILRTVTDSFPAVTSVRVKDALDTINGILNRLALAIRSASSITLIASVLVLAGALAAGHRHRIYDAVILKTLGATRGRLLAAYGAEYLLLGLATAVFGVFAGTLAAWGVVTFVMQFDFALLPGVAIGGAVLALAVTVLLGIGGTWQVLSRKPARVLRSL